MRRDTLLIIGILAIALGFLGLCLGPARSADYSYSWFSPIGGRIMDSLHEAPLTDASAMNPDASHVTQMTRASSRHSTVP